MFKRCVLALMLASLSLGVQVSERAGSKVLLRTSNGGVYEGEIIAVRDSVLAFAVPHGLSEQDFVGPRSVVRVFHRNDIRSVSMRIEGRAAPFERMFWGGLLGCTLGSMIGFAIGKNQEEEVEEPSCFGGTARVRRDRSLEGAVVGGSVGSVGGAVVGYVASGYEEMILYDATNEAQLSSLARFSRYKTDEPEYLRELLDKATVK